MNDYNLIKGKSVALLVWNTEKENDACIYIGEITQEHDGFYFINKSKNWRVTLDDEKMDRLKEVTEDVKEIFMQADFGISLSMASLPAEHGESLISTGMKWHE